MAEIKFTGNKTLKSINKEWCAKFPHTYLGFFSEDGKAGMSWENTHASIRGKKDADELLITSQMKVSTFESRYQAAFGCKVDIKFQKNGKLFNSSKEHNEMTLSELNAWAKENGASNIREENPDWF
ncbi:MAG: hypothetical protein EBS17_07005 [Flavobacteriia bacterium]|nr:hypothetical protein [Flavobacteriia bacterium]